MSESSTVSSAPQFTNAVNMCPGGIALGIYSANLEHLFSKRHGVMLRFDYEDVPKNYTDADIASNGMAVILNYRWHLSEQLNSCYIGAYTRYRVYSGSGQLESTKFDFTLPEVTLGLNVGKRWAWKSGFNINLAFGYGVMFKDRSSDPSTPAIKSTLDKYEKAYDFIDPFLGEFSIGYAF